MRRHARQSGAALILLIIIVSILAILATTLVVVVINQEGATADARSRKTTAYYSEAALDEAVTVAKTKTISTTSEWLTPTELAAAFSSAGFPAGATLTYRVYDNLNPVNYSIKWDQGSPTSATTPDGMVWVEATVNYLGKSSRMRTLVRQVQQTVMQGLPRAVLYSDTSITASNTSDLYAVNPDNTPDVSGSPFPTSVMAGDSFTSNSSSDLAAPGTGVQSLAIKVNGSVSTAGHTFQDVTHAPGTVGLLSDYFDQAAQADLGDEAQTGKPTQALDNVHGATTVAASTITGNSTYGGVNGVSAIDVYVSGNLTLPSSGTRYFKSLYVTGNLTQSSGGTFNCTKLYVGGNLTITSSSAATFKLGPTYVAGTADWNGTGSLPSSALSVQTTDWTNAGAAAGPLWAKILNCSGAFNVTLGDTWLDGDAGTSSVAIEFDGPTSGSNYSQVMCPLMASTEKTVTTGKVNFGTLTTPMTYYMMCDNDGLYSNTCEWGSSGTFYGLMVVMEAVIQITGGDGTLAHPSIEGAIFSGTPYVSGTTASTSDITLTGNSTVVYDQAVIDKVSNASITTTTTTIQAVPGSWQQLSPQ